MLKFIKKKYNLFIIRQYRKLFKECIGTYYKKSYSIDGEDMLVSSFFASDTDYKGFYVDIGAHHPFLFSNTHYFYEKGWRGINIDPTPGSMEAFNKFRTEDINLEIGIGAKKDILEFFMFKQPACNTFDKKLASERENIYSLKEIKTIPVHTINEILEKYLPENTKIDLLNVDVEGLDLEIIKSLNWEKYLPKFLMIEDLSLKEDCNIFSENQKSELVDFLFKKGYVPITKTRRTIIFKRDENN